LNDNLSLFVDLLNLESLVACFMITVKQYNFSCILIWRFFSVEISLHFNLVFSQGVLCEVKLQVTLAMWTLCITYHLYYSTSRPTQCMFEI